MDIRRNIRRLCLLLTLGAGAQMALAQQENEIPGEKSRAVAVGEVPAVVMANARSAAPDVFFGKAAWYWQDDHKVYHLSGALFREEFNVYVRDTGDVLRVNRNNRDED